MAFAQKTHSQDSHLGTFLHDHLATNATWGDITSLLIQTYKVYQCLRALKTPPDFCEVKHFWTLQNAKHLDMANQTFLFYPLPLTGLVCLANCRLIFNFRVSIYKQKLLFMAMTLNSCAVVCHFYFIQFLLVSWIFKPWVDSLLQDLLDFILFYSYSRCPYVLV